MRQFIPAIPANKDIANRPFMAQLNAMTPAQQANQLQLPLDQWQGMSRQQQEEEIRRYLESF